MSNKNPFIEKLISFYMTLFAILLVYMYVKEYMPRDINGIIDYICNSVI